MDNGVLFISQVQSLLLDGHSVDRIYRDYGVAHRLTKPSPPVDQRSRRAPEPHDYRGPHQRGHFQTTDEPNEYRQAFLLTYNHARQLKKLRDLAPHEFGCAQWEKHSANFVRDLT